MILLLGDSEGGASAAQQAVVSLDPGTVFLPDGAAGARDAYNYP